MNPFADYLPCYPPGTVAERPWWVRRVVRGQPQPDEDRWWWRWERGDGGSVPGSIYVGPRRFSKFELPPCWPAGVDDISAMDAYDLAHPLPVPAVLAGQVWAFEQRPLSPIFLTVAGHGGMKGGVTFAAGSPIDAPSYAPNVKLPPVGAVLVYGPLAPWAPPGWKP